MRRTFASCVALANRPLGSQHSKGERTVGPITSPATRIYIDAHHDRARSNPEFAHALLEGVASGREPETFRIYRPGRYVAFGPVEGASAGYAAARQAATTRGYQSFVRMSGGRAAVCHEDMVAFSWTVADRDARLRICHRFAWLAKVVAESLRSLGLDAHVGEVSGEYCPGRFSINAVGRRKLGGLGQRVVRGGAHLDGIIVVAGSKRIVDVLVPVYDELGFAWEPATVSSIEDERAGVRWDDAVEALEWAFATRYKRDRDSFPGVVDDT